MMRIWGCRRCWLAFSQRGGYSAPSGEKTHRPTEVLGSAKSPSTNGGGGATFHVAHSANKKLEADLSFKLPHAFLRPFHTWSPSLSARSIFSWMFLRLLLLGWANRRPVGLYPGGRVPEGRGLGPGLSYQPLDLDRRVHVGGRGI